MRIHDLNSSKNQEEELVKRLNSLDCIVNIKEKPKENSVENILSAGDFEGSSAGEDSFVSMKKEDTQKEILKHRYKEKLAKEIEKSIDFTKDPEIIAVAIEIIVIYRYKFHKKLSLGEIIESISWGVPIGIDPKLYSLYKNMRQYSVHLQENEALGTVENWKDVKKELKKLIFLYGDEEEFRLPNISQDSYNDWLTWIDCVFALIVQGRYTLLHLEYEIKKNIRKYPLPWQQIDFSNTPYEIHKDLIRGIRATKAESMKILKKSKN